MYMIMKEVIKVIGLKVMTSSVMKTKVMRRKKSPTLYHLSASVLLMRKTTDIILKIKA